MDNLTPEQRTKNMKNIRSEGTRPELKIARELKRRRIYFSTHPKTVLGKPDILFRRKKIAVFIDSDFWHGNPGHFKMPKSNMRYWKAKISRNRSRDKEVTDTLRKSGWKVIRIWEHDVYKNFSKSVARIVKCLK
ncbi:MAG: very short patch repair endonuclease [Candidatus Margulisiibacteriota bacterium]